MTRVDPVRAGDTPLSASSFPGPRPACLPPSLPVYLAGVVEGKPIEKGVGEEFHHAEGAVDHPIGQPGGVVILGRALDGADAETETGRVESQSTLDLYAASRHFHSPL